jgi:hypothetical protein
MNSPFLLQSELGRARTQLAESLANLPASISIGTETESWCAIAPPGGQHLMKSSVASAANRHGLEWACCQGWANIRSETC